MKDGVTKRQDQQREPSAIGMTGESCLGKRRRCVQDKGLHTRKRKRGIPESVPRGRESGQGGNESREGPRHGGRDDGTLYRKRARQARGKQGARNWVTYGAKNERVFSRQ